MMAENEQQPLKSSLVLTLALIFAWTFSWIIIFGPFINLVVEPPLVELMPFLGFESLDAVISTFFATLPVIGLMALGKGANFVKFLALRPPYELIFYITLVILLAVVIAAGAKREYDKK